MNLSKNCPGVPVIFMETVMASLISELVAYMGARKKWWLLPILIILLGIGGLLVLAQGSAVAPFIYTVF